MKSIIIIGPQPNNLIQNIKYLFLVLFQTLLKNFDQNLQLCFFLAVEMANFDFCVSDPNNFVVDCN